MVGKNSNYQFSTIGKTSEFLFWVIIFCTIICLIKVTLSFISCFISPLPFYFPKSPKLFNQGSLKGVAECFLLGLFVVLLVMSFFKSSSVYLSNLATLSIFSFSDKKVFRLYLSILLVILLLAGFSNIILSNNLPSWTIDNGAFIPRYVNLHYTFPHLSYYDTYWQAGCKQLEIIITGILGIWVLFYLLLLPEYIDLTYKFIAPILILLMPFSVYFTARCFGLHKEQSLCAGVFSFAATSNWFSPINCLIYGMYPYFLTSVLFPLFIGLVYKLWSEKRGRKRNIIFAVLIALFALPHLTFLFMIVGLLLFCIAFWVKPITKSFQKFESLKKMKIIVSIIVCLSFMILGIFFTIPGVCERGISLITSSVKTYIKLASLYDLNGSEVLLQMYSWIKPRVDIFSIVLFLGLFQTLIWIKLKDRRGIFLLFSISWLLILGWLGSFFLRGTEPIRFLTPVSLLLLIPFCQSWNALLTSFKAWRLGWKKSILFACIVFLFFYAILLTTGIFSFIEQSPPRVKDIQKWLTENVGSDGRVYLELDGHKGIGGMPGRLCQITGLHFMGERYSNRDRRELFINNFPIILSNKYFQIYNIQHLLLTTEEIQKYVEEVLGLHPIRKFGPVKAYQTGIHSTFFAKGKGTLQVKLNEISIDLQPNPPETVIIRFHFVEGFKVTEGVTVFGVDNECDKQFIAIRPNGKTNIKLRW